MTSLKSRFGLVAAAATLAASTFTSTLQAQPQTLQSALANQNIRVSKLRVKQVEGIVIVQGGVNRAEHIARVGQIARGLGYGRVANMVKFEPLPDDQALVLEAERQLALTRSLEGCRLQVICTDGVLTVRGTVESELQKDVARDVLQRIDGVRSVESDLQRV